MHTREQYLKGVISHHNYYMQFATTELMDLMVRKIGLNRICDSKDEHFNDIPVEEWDALSGHSFSSDGKICIYDYNAWRKAFNGGSSSDRICVFKAMAKSIRGW